MKQYRQKSIQPMNPAELRISAELAEVQHMMPMSADDRERLKKDIEATGEIRDSIKVYYDEDDNCVILGGYNRWQIAMELGWNVVPVEITNYTPQERRIFVVMDNLARRHLTREQKSRIVEMFLKETPEVSDRAIGKKVGVDHKTVSSTRTRLEQTGEIPRFETRKSLDGKERKKPVRQIEPEPEVPKRQKKTKKETELDILKETIFDVLSAQPKAQKEEMKKQLMAFIKSI